MKKIYFLFTIFILISCNNDYQETIYYPEYSVKQYDLNLINLINNFRIQNNKTILNIDYFLENVSYSHTIFMCENHICSTDGYYKRAANFFGNHFGELSINGFTTESGLMNYMINDESSVIILLGDFNYIGCSSQVSDDNKTYITIDFLKKQ